MNLGQYLGELLLRGEVPATTAASTPEPRRPAERAKPGQRLSPVRFKILKYVARCANPPRLHDIAVHLGRPTTHVSGFLTTLVRDGLLAREGLHHQYDYHVTPAGRAAVIS